MGYFIAALALAQNAPTKQDFHVAVRDFAKVAEIYIESVGVKDIQVVERLGKRALEAWGKIPSPSKELPNTKEIRRLRTPTNGLAKLIGGQMLDIANDGYITAEALQKRLLQSQLAYLKRELK